MEVHIIVLMLRLRASKSYAHLKLKTRVTRLVIISAKLLTPTISSAVKITNYFNRCQHRYKAYILAACTSALCLVCFFHACIRLV